MIETLPEARTTADVDPPEPVLEAFRGFAARLERRGTLVWGEHCQECAYPSCYADCAFYTPRSDFHCRRFRWGIEKLANAASLWRVVFRKWGKLEARGPGGLRAAAQVADLEARDGRVSGLLGLPLAPLAVRRSLSARWNASKGGHPAAAVPDPAAVFVVEGWSPDGRDQAFTLTILNGVGAGRAAPAILYQTRFSLGADYRRLEVGLRDIAARVDLSAPFLVQIEPVGEAEGVAAVFGVCDFVTMASGGESADVRRDGDGQPSLARGAKGQGPAKVLVWDLDETLWEGVLAEEGARGVRLRPEAERAVRGLDARGVLQTIASKNDFREAMTALEGFGLAEFFLHPQIHHEPKSASLAAQASLLGLGLDSFVFIDDQPFERAEVEAAHPVVRTLSHDVVDTLLDHPWFDVPTTPESRKRRRLYQEEATRAVALQSAGDDYESFLRSSGLRLEIAALAASDAERVFELTQRTNQLNFNGRRFSREDVAALIAAGAPKAYTLRCADRFGDYGLIGFAVADVGTGRLDEFFMSCRVQRKRVEQAFFDWLRRTAESSGASCLTAAYTPTERNKAAFEMLAQLGFEKEEGGRWRRGLQPIVSADVVAVGAPPHLVAA